MQIKTKNSLLMLLLLPVLASAAGIGKINVKSALGEPLNAEVEVFTSDSNELDLAVARVGSLQDYTDAGIQDAYVSGVNANIIKKSNGRYAIELQGNQAVNDPYLELLVKLDTKTSNLMRQYTVLLDPPLSALHEEFAQESHANAGVSANKTVGKKKNQIDAAKDNQLTTQADSEPREASASSSSSLVTTKQIGASKTHQTSVGHVTASDETYVAQTGDVFGKIAQRYQPEGVPLVKVMAAFYALNKNAFVDGDMHKLKTGSVIHIPDQDSLNNAGHLKTAHADKAQAVAQKPVPLTAPAVEPVNPPVNQFRQASKPFLSESPKAEPTPPLDKNVSDNPTKGDPNYVLKVSPGDTSVSVSQPAPTPSTDIAKASKDGAGQAQSDMESGVSSQSASSQSASSSGSNVVQPVDNLQKNNGLAAAANNAEAGNSFAESLHSYWTAILLVLGLLIIALLAWFGYHKQRNSVKDLRNHFSPVFGEEILPIEPAAPVFSSASVVASGDIQSTASQSFQHASFEKPSDALASETLMGEDEVNREFVNQPHQIDTNKPVDPLIEAELYMTYGRHKQAETILTSVDTPYKLELSLGLLKIYSDRKDKAAFERIVHSIHDDLTSGSIEDAMIWSKVVALGAKVDPDNPLYGGASKVRKLSARERAMAAEKAMRESLMPFESDTTLVPAAFEPIAEPQPVVESNESKLETLDNIEVPEKTNEIEFTLEDMVPLELSDKQREQEAGSKEANNIALESGDANALFAKLKDGN